MAAELTRSEYAYFRDERADMCAAHYGSMLIAYVCLGRPFEDVSTNFAESPTDEGEAGSFYGSFRCRFTLYREAELGADYSAPGERSVERPAIVAFDLYEIATPVCALQFREVSKGLYVAQKLTTQRRIIKLYQDALLLPDADSGDSITEAFFVDKHGPGRKPKVTSAARGSDDGSAGVLAVPKPRGPLPTLAAEAPLNPNA